MIELLAWPFVAGLVLTGMHAWLGLHVLPLPVEGALAAFEADKIDGFIGIPTAAPWVFQNRTPPARASAKIANSPLPSTLAQNHAACGAYSDPCSISTLPMKPDRAGASAGT